MKTIKKEIKIYDFDELNQEIQKKLIEEEKEKMQDNYCEYWLKNDMEEKSKKLLEKYFGKKAIYKNVLYSLNWLQGDGAMIEFELTYYNKTFNIKNYGHYCHENAFIIDTYELTDRQKKQLKEKIYKMNCELSKYGYNTIKYYWNADNEAIENLQNYVFLENGEIYIDKI